ncbi:3-hydroxybutyryl-CoA dehydrogenase [Puccinia sorghi]|uniref:3-hydroxybutyryl-CoA dehydrogenase n=1 Tax=Puccinia sorghi TaxID=27349 RepID=A0A0L6VEF6_9BASI|nr:3-hydroxybutyryl-CoA dehydrogenase [Puccinia sorghi]
MSRCFQSGRSAIRSIPFMRVIRLDAARQISSVAVIGAGQMGTGIAFVAAKVSSSHMNSLKLHIDPSAEISRLLECRRQCTSPRPTSSGARKRTRFHWSVQHLTHMDKSNKLLAKDVAKEKMIEHEAKAVRERVRAIGDLNELKDVDLVIEAVAEKLPLKQAIFSQLASICKPGAILASNTSSISLTKIAASAINPTNNNTPQSATPDPSPSRVVGLHFFNPVPIMSLVELIAALQTSQDTLKRAREFAVRCGKVVTVSKDTPGFISNRVGKLLIHFYFRINEAIICLEEGVATRDDIDQTMKRGTNVPMGPLTLADFIGLDTCLSIMQVLYNQTSDSKYRPSVLLSRMVDAGWLGRLVSYFPILSSIDHLRVHIGHIHLQTTGKKAGRGFYEYERS